MRRDSTQSRGEGDRTAGDLRIVLERQRETSQRTRGVSGRGRTIDRDREKRSEGRDRLRQRTRLRSRRRSISSRRSEERMLDSMKR